MKEVSEKPVNQTASGQKKVYLEALRVLAIVFILFQHQPAYNLFLVSTGGAWWFYAALSVFTRMNVPVFFMISGVLLLAKEEDLKTLYRKRILRHMLVILIFSGVYFILFAVRGGTEDMSAGYAVWTFIVQVLSNKVEGSQELWFLYAYLGFLIMLPFMRRIAREGTKKDLFYLMALRFVLYSLLPALNLLLLVRHLPQIEWSKDFILPLVMFDAFFFPLFGFLADRVWPADIRKKDLPVLFCVMVFSILCPVVLTYVERQAAGEVTQHFITQFDYLLAGSVFLLVKYLYTNVSFFRRESVQKRTVFLGSLTFGIYLMDHLLKEALWAPYYLHVDPYLPTILMSAGWILISFVICGAVTWLLKKIPGLGKLI